MNVLSLRQLQYFVAVAKTGSFTAAAERLNVSQPAIGIQVKQLEDRLGVTLFERHSRGVDLTGAGAVYLGYAETALETLAEAEFALEQFRDSDPARVRMGVTPTIERTLLPLLFFKAALPEIEIRIDLDEGFSDQLHQRVLDGTLDCAFCYDPQPDPRVNIMPLYREDLHLVGPAAVVGADTTPVDFASLEGMPLVLSPQPSRLRSMVEEAAAGVGCTLTPAMEFSLAGLKREVLLRYAYCALSPYGLFLQDIENGELTARRVVNPQMARTMHFVVNRKLPARIAQRLQTLIRELIDESLDAGTMKWIRLD